MQKLQESEEKREKYWDDLYTCFIILNNLNKQENFKKYSPQLHPIPSPLQLSPLLNIPALKYSGSAAIITFV